MYYIVDRRNFILPAKFIVYCAYIYTGMFGFLYDSGCIFCKISIKLAVKVALRGVGGKGHRNKK